MALHPQKRKSAVVGSPIGQRHMDSRSSMIVTRSDGGTATSRAAPVSATSSSAGRAGPGVGAATGSRAGGPAGRSTFRGFGSPVGPALTRPDRPRRWTLPITALREHPPISAAIWLALRPSAHSRFRSSTRSSVQVIAASVIHGLLLGSHHPQGPESLIERGRRPVRASSENETGDDDRRTRCRTRRLSGYKTGGLGRKSRGLRLAVFPNTCRPKLHRCRWVRPNHLELTETYAAVKVGPCRPSRGGAFVSGSIGSRFDPV